MITLAFALKMCNLFLLLLYRSKNCSKHIENRQHKLQSKHNELLTQKTVSSPRWTWLVVRNRKFSTAIKILITHQNNDFNVHYTAHHHELLSEEVSLYIARATAKNNGWSAGSSFFVKTMHFALRSNSDCPFPPAAPAALPVCAWPS